LTDTSLRQLVTSDQNLLILQIAQLSINGKISIEHEMLLKFLPQICELILEKLTRVELRRRRALEKELRAAMKSKIYKTKLKKTLKMASEEIETKSSSLGDEKVEIKSVCSTETAVAEMHPTFKSFLQTHSLCYTIYAYSVLGILKSQQKHLDGELVLKALQGLIRCHDKVSCMEIIIFANYFCL
jgi:hypothetical protein